MNWLEARAVGGWKVDDWGMDEILNAIARGKRRIVEAGREYRPQPLRVELNMHASKIVKSFACFILGGLDKRYVCMQM